MMDISVNTSAFDQLAQRMRAMASQHVQQAVSDALNSVAFNVKERSGPAEMRRVFNNPTPFTLRSLFVKKATPQTLRATVGLGRDLYSKSRLTPEEILGHQIVGGGRRHKSLEGWLRAHGLIGQSEYVYPGRGAKLDQHGNMSRGQIMQLLSHLKIAGDRNQHKSDSKRSKRNTRRAGNIFWSRGSGGRDSLPRGAWIHLSNGVVAPVLVVIGPPAYKARFDLKRVAEQTLAARFDKQFKYFYRREMKRAGLA